MQNDEAVFPYRKTVARGKQILEIVQSLLAQIEKPASDNDRLIAAGKIHEIGREFGTALRAYADAAGAHEAVVRTAIVHLKIAEPVRALQVIRPFVDKDPGYRFKDISGRPLSGLTILGDALRANGDIDAAQQAYAEALKLVPEDTHSAGQLARIYIAHDEFEKAVSLGNRFLDDDETAALQSTTRLLANDPNRLPALAGLVHNFSAKLSDVR